MTNPSTSSSAHHDQAHHDANDRSGTLTEADFGGPWQWPVAVLSDLHLGHPNSKLTDPSQILPLIADARTVIFNGDTFEEISHRRREASRKQATQLAQLCLDRKIRPIFLTGNHDPRATSAHALELLDGQVLITHGDGLHPDIAPWSPDRTALAEERQRLRPQPGFPKTLDQWLALIKQADVIINRFEPPQLTPLFGFLHFLRHFLTKPWRVLFALRYWMQVPGLALDLRNRYRPNAKIMLIGHSHRPGIFRRDDLTIINTGSYQPLSWPWVAYITPEEVKVFKAQRQADQFELGRLKHRQTLAKPALVEA